jgi:hypothetical protein
MLNKQHAILMASLIIGGIGLGAVSAAIHNYASLEPKLTYSEPTIPKQATPVVEVPKVEITPNPEVTESDSPINDEKPEEVVQPEEEKVIPKAKTVSSDNAKVQVSVRDPDPVIKRKVIVETQVKRDVKNNDNDQAPVKPKRRIKRDVEKPKEQDAKPEPKIIKTDYDSRTVVKDKNNDDQEPKVRTRRRNVKSVEGQPNVEPKTPVVNQRRQPDKVEDVKKSIEETPVKRRQRDMDEPRTEKSVDEPKPKMASNKPDVEITEEPKSSPKELNGDSPKKAEQ